MTTGEKIVELSDISLGTAMEHLLNITTEEPSINMATDYFEEKLGKLLFLNENLAKVGDMNGIKGSEVAGNFYIALFTANPGEEGDMGVEADYNGYTRVPIERGSTHWEYKYNSIRNIDPIVWPAAESEDVVTHFGIVDSLIDGDLLYYNELKQAIPIAIGNYIEIGYNELVIKIY